MAKSISSLSGNWLVAAVTVVNARMIFSMNLSHEFIKLTFSTSLNGMVWL